VDRHRANDQYLIPVGPDNAGVSKFSFVWIPKLATQQAMATFYLNSATQLKLVTEDHSYISLATHHSTSAGVIEAFGDGVYIWMEVLLTLPRNVHFQLPATLFSLLQGQIFIKVEQDIMTKFGNCEDTYVSISIYHNDKVVAKGYVPPTQEDWNSLSVSAVVNAKAGDYVYFYISGAGCDIISVDSST